MVSQSANGGVSVTAKGPGKNKEQLKEEGVSTSGRYFKDTRGKLTLYKLTHRFYLAASKLRRLGLTTGTFYKCNFSKCELVLGQKFWETNGIQRLLNGGSNGRAEHNLSFAVINIGDPQTTEKYIRSRFILHR